VVAVLGFLQLTAVYSGFFMIEQALYGSAGAGGYRFLARSAGFGEEWLAEAEKLCTGFGERPSGVACPGCVFARPLGGQHVAVVQAADQGVDDTGRPGALTFRLLIVPAPLYRDLGGDPFLIADQYPSPWAARGVLPSLEWTAGAPTPRTVEALRRVLNVPNSATLLGGAQALLDGARLVFERPAPDERLVRSLWALLPRAERCQLWPATFCFGNAHGFHVLVTPRASGPQYDHYIPEEQAGDYPEGRYELALQIAVESGNQRDLDTLLARRSRSQTLRLLLVLLGVSILVALVTARVPPPPRRAASTRTRLDALVLPSPRECPRLSAAERDGLADRLRELGRRLGFAGPAGSSDEDLTAALAAADARLGTPDPRRDPGPLPKLGAIQRQVRALLWKQGVAGYDNPSLNTVEVIERLGRHLDRPAAPRDGRGS
jgi:hypothetical protein